ncbi:MAG: hypothetical protein AAGI48_16290 [Verrucomicrobiota bacterium]
MSKSLSVFNDEMAAVFKNCILENITWLYQLHKEELDARAAQEAVTLSKVMFLPSLVRENLIGKNKTLVSNMLKELNVFYQLEIFMGKASRIQALESAKKKGKGRLDFRMIKLIVDFLESKARPVALKDGIGSDAFTRLSDLYHLRRDFYERFLEECGEVERLLIMFCESGDLKGLGQMDEGARKQHLLTKGGGSLLNAWQIAATIAESLVRGENSLTAREAYWLGIVEEVVGERDLPCQRVFVESSS